MDEVSAREISVEGQSYRVFIERFPGPMWARLERDLDAAGRPLPLYHRRAWLAAGESESAWFVGVRGSSGQPECGFAAELHRTRALPGHSFLLIQRFGTVYEPAALHAGLLALRDAVKANRRLLRVEVETFVADSDKRANIASALVSTGFVPRPLRLYRDTVSIDLTRSEEDIFASLHATARRHIRALAKNPVELRPVADAKYATRMNDLLRETMQRTGGDFQPAPWMPILELCAKAPELARLVGLFRTGSDEPDALIAYALGLAHGDHVEYLTAASTRDPSLRMPLVYALAWDLIRWGKSLEKSWFDFGGIAAEETEASPEGTKGIADFKRYFSRDIIAVGGRWSYEPHPLRSAVSRQASSLVSMLKRFAVRRPFW